MAFTSSDLNIPLKLWPQVNTDPMRSKRAYVEVVVPPSILDTKGSADLVVREALTVGGTKFIVKIIKTKGLLKRP